MSFWPDSIMGWAALIVCIVLAALPPRYDPAVRLREWLDRRREPQRDIYAEVADELRHPLTVPYGASADKLIAEGIGETYNGNRFGPGRRETREEFLLREAHARQARVNLDGTPRREARPQ